MYKCIYCNAELTWGGDLDAEDVWDEEYKGRLYSNYSCPACGAEVFAISPEESLWEKIKQKQEENMRPVNDIVKSIQHKAAQLSKAEARFAEDGTTFNGNNMYQTRNALNALARELLNATEYEND